MHFSCSEIVIISIRSMLLTNCSNYDDIEGHSQVCNIVLLNVSIRIKDFMHSAFPGVRRAHVLNRTRTFCCIR